MYLCPMQVMWALIWLDPRLGKNTYTTSIMTHAHIPYTCITTSNTLPETHLHHQQVTSQDG